MNFANLEVKPLEWNSDNACNTTLCGYFISINENETYTLHRCWYGVPASFICLGEKFISLQSAKNHAQKDYEKQIAKLLFRKKTT